jgi:TRAP-type C4-dicarboxylate transport system permease small subunit
VRRGPAPVYSRRHGMILRVIERISSVSGWLSGIGVIVMVVVVIVDVFLRYFFSRPLLFADDVGVYCMIYIAFVGAALTLKMRRHIMVDLLYARLPRKVQSWLDVITTLLGTLVICIITWESADWVHYTYESGFRSPGILQTPMWIPMAVVPLGLFFWSMQYIVESIKAINGLRGQHLQAKERVTNA